MDCTEGDKLDVNIRFSKYRIEQASFTIELKFMRNGRMDSSKILVWNEELYLKVKICDHTTRVSAIVWQ